MKNVLSVLGRYEKNEKESETRLVYSVTVLTKLRLSIDFRSTLSKEFFKTELFRVSQSLAKTSIELYHSNKSDVLSVFTKCDMLLTGLFGAINIELSPLVQTHDLTNCRTFLDLQLAHYSRIPKIAAGCIRVDIFTDRYFNNSLKKIARGARGYEGTTLEDVSDHDEIPSDFQKDFIRNSLNKDTLYQYLAETLIDLQFSATQILAVTYKDTILKIQDVPDEGINWYKYEEDYARVIRHFISVSKCRMFDTIVVCSSDTNVLLLCLAYYRHCEFEGSTCTVFCEIGMNPSSKIYNVNVNAQAIGLNTCQVLPFFHTYTGCDTVSSFFNCNKKSMWEAWHKYPNH